MSGQWSALTNVQVDYIHRNLILCFRTVTYKIAYFQISQSTGLESYKITKQFPPKEKFTMTQQIRRAPLSIILNVLEGCSRKSAIEIASNTYNLQLTTHKYGY